MIILSFLSGELVQFSADDFFPGATIYNLKRRICDWIEENEDKEKEEKYPYDKEENDIDLVHIFDEKDNILEDNEPIDNDEDDNDEDTLYKVFINKYDRRVIYTKEGSIYYHSYGESPSDNDPQICREDMPTLQETSTIKYLFDLASFRECLFFEELGYDDNNDIWNDEDDDIYNNIWREIQRKERRKTKKQLDSLSIRRLRSIFPQLKIRFISFGI